MKTQTIRNTATELNIDTKGTNGTDNLLMKIKRTLLERGYTTTFPAYGTTRYIKGNSEVEIVKITAGLAYDTAKEIYIIR